jgi:hypothetical protein
VEAALGAAGRAEQWRAVLEMWLGGVEILWFMVDQWMVICMDVIINIIITSIIVMDGLWMCWQGHNRRIPCYVDILNQVVATLGRAFSTSVRTLEQSVRRQVRGMRAVTLSSKDYHVIFGVGNRVRLLDDAWR